MCSSDRWAKLLGMDRWTASARDVIAMTAAELLDAGRATLRVVAGTPARLFLEPTATGAAAVEVVAHAKQINVVVGPGGDRQAVAAHEIWYTDEAQRLAELASCVEALIHGRVEIAVVEKPQRRFPAFWTTMSRPVESISLPTAPGAADRGDHDWR